MQEKQQLTINYDDVDGPRTVVLTAFDHIFRDAAEKHKGKRDKELADALCEMDGMDEIKRYLDGELHNSPSGEPAVVKVHSRSTEDAEARERGHTWDTTVKVIQYMTYGFLNDPIDGVPAVQVIEYSHMHSFGEKGKTTKLLSAERFENNYTRGRLSKDEIAAINNGDTLKKLADKAITKTARFADDRAKYKQAFGDRVHLTEVTVDPSQEEGSGFIRKEGRHAKNVIGKKDQNFKFAIREEKESGFSLPDGTESADGSDPKPGKKRDFFKGLRKKL